MSINKISNLIDNDPNPNMSDEGDNLKGYEVCESEDYLPVFVITSNWSGDDVKAQIETYITDPSNEFFPYIHVMTKNTHGTIYIAVFDPILYFKWRNDSAFHEDDLGFYISPYESKTNRYPSEDNDETFQLYIPLNTQYSRPDCLARLNDIMDVLAQMHLMPNNSYKVNIPSKNGDKYVHRRKAIIKFDSNVHTNVIVMIKSVIHGCLWNIDNDDNSEIHCKWMKEETKSHYNSYYNNNSYHNYEADDTADNESDDVDFSDSVTTTTTVQISPDNAWSKVPTEVYNPVSKYQSLVPRDIPQQIQSEDVMTRIVVVANGVNVGEGPTYASVISQNSSVKVHECHKSDIVNSMFIIPKHIIDFIRNDTQDNHIIKFC